MGIDNKITAFEIQKPAPKRTVFAISQRFMGELFFLASYFHLIVVWCSIGRGIRETTAEGTNYSVESGAFARLSDQQLWFDFTGKAFHGFKHRFACCGTRVELPNDSIGINEFQETIDLINAGRWRANDCTSGK